MKNITLCAAMLLSACTSTTVVSLEQDRTRHNEFLESVYHMENYDPEHVDDCYFYQELVCEFEE